MTSDAHIGFVVAAYAVAAFVILGMILAVFLDYRVQRRALRRLESPNGDAP